MHDCKVKLKDGRLLHGPIWEWRPRDGFFTLVTDKDEDGTVWLRDVEQATQHNQRVSRDKIGNVDLLARARKDGWDGT